MADHPIIFSGPMVRAILDGRKTQTRRVVRFAHSEDVAAWAQDDDPARWRYAQAGDFGRRADMGAIRCPYGQPGDKLWVRETWQAIHVSIDPETGCGDEVIYAWSIPRDDRGGYWAAVYAATDPQAADHRDDRGFPWCPSTHMPRWACRLTLAVTEIRVERLQAITEEDARKEGAGYGISALCGFPPDFADRTDGVGSYRDCFRQLWDSINGKRPGCSWAANPWVWVVDFRPEEVPHA